MSIILTIGLLNTTSTVKAIVACSWLVSTLVIRYELFHLWDDNGRPSQTYGGEDVLERHHTVGVNGVLLALDAAHKEVCCLHQSRVVADEEWEQLDSLYFREQAPYDPTPKLYIRFLQ